MDINIVKNIELKKVEDLIENPRNTRTHSDAQIDEICNSIKEFGFNNPIQIDDENVVWAGHGRLRAAKRLKLKKVPTILNDKLTPAQRKAFGIADNKIALNAGWDTNNLRLEMEELHSLDYNLNVTGMDEIEIAAVLGGSDILGEEEPSEHENEGDGTLSDGDSGVTIKNFNITYQLLFSNLEEQEIWFKFLTKLKLEQPEAETISERICSFIQENVDLSKI